MSGTPKTTSPGGPTNKILSVGIVVLLLLSAYMVTEVSSLQGQVSSLQNQNANLQNQVGNLQVQQNYLQNQLNRLLTTTTQTKIFSFDVQNLCVSVNPLCYTYPGFQRSYVYLMTIVNNGTVTIPVTSSVLLAFKDGARLTFFNLNTSLPQSILPGASVYLNSTSWPAYTNATSKIAPGDDLGVTVTVGSLDFTTETHVLACSSSTTTFRNYTSTQTETLTSCV